MRPRAWSAPWLPTPPTALAIVVFAGRGVIRYPLTENLGAVVDVLHRLRPGSVRPGGTDLGAGLDAALETLGQEEHAAGGSIVVFSDGEDLADHWRSRLDRLVQAGVIVHVVAIGDPEQGHPVPSGTGDQPLSYQGKKVLSRRVDTHLEAIAQETDGAIMKLGLAAADLKTLYRTRISPVAQRKRAAGRFAERPERFPLFLAAALGLALSGCWPGGRIGPWRWVWSRVAGAVLLGGLAVAGIGAGQGQRNGSLPPDPGSAGTRTSSHSAQAAIPPGAPAAALVARGESAYLAGHFTEALSMFESAIERAPGQPIPRYDAAATLFQLQRYEEARGAIKRPATEQELRCARRSIMLWATRRWCWAISPARSSTMTTAWPRPRLARALMRSGRTRQSTASSRWSKLLPPSHRRARATVISLLPSGTVRPVYASEATAGATQRPTIQPGPIRNLLARTRRVKRATGQRKAAGEPEAAGEPVPCPLGLRANHRTTAWTKLSTRFAMPSAGGSPRIRHSKSSGDSRKDW